MTTIVNRTMMVIACRFIHVSKSYCKNIVIRKPVKVLNLPPEQVVETVNVKSWQSLKTIDKEVDAPAIIKKPEENIVSYEKLSKYDKRFM